MRWVNLVVALMLIPFMFHRISTGDLVWGAIDGGLALLNLLFWRLSR
jgi:hypothetical protein